MRLSVRLPLSLSSLVMVCLQVRVLSSETFESSPTAQSTTIQTMAEILPDAPSPITFEYKAPPFKKRKFLRQRNVDEDEDRSKSPEQTATSTSNSGTTNLNETKARDSDSKARDEEPESDLSLAEITKLRKKNARIRQGLQLTVPTPSGKEQDQPQNASEEGKRNAEIVAITNRFTHQTGQVLDVDKHM